MCVGRHCKDDPILNSSSTVRQNLGVVLAVLRTMNNPLSVGALGGAIPHPRLFQSSLVQKHVAAIQMCLDGLYPPVFVTFLFAQHLRGWPRTASPWCSTTTGWEPPLPTTTSTPSRKAAGRFYPSNRLGFAILCCGTVSYRGGRGVPPFENTNDSEKRELLIGVHGGFARGYLTGEKGFR